MSESVLLTASPIIARSHSDPLLFGEDQPPQHHPDFTQQFTAPAHVSVASLPLETLSSLVDLPSESPFFSRVDSSSSSSSDSPLPSAPSSSAAAVVPLGGGMPAITHLIDETFHQNQNTRALLVDDDDDIFSESHEVGSKNSNASGSDIDSSTCNSSDMQIYIYSMNISEMEQKNESKSSNESHHHTMRVKEENIQPFPLLRLAVNELTHVLIFLDIHSLLMVGKTNHSLRTLSASDVVWRCTLWKFYCTYHAYDQDLTAQFMTEQLKMKQFIVYDYAINSKMGWKGAYLKFKIPPLVPSTKLNWDDFQVFFFTALNTADVATDLIVLVGYAHTEQWPFFGLSLASLIGSALVLCKMDLDRPGNPIGMAPRKLLWLLNFFQLRMIYEAWRYFKKRAKRAMQTGTELKHFVPESSKEEQESVQMIKLFEGVFESAPQTLLQNYTLIGLGQFSVVGIISILLSLFSVSLVFAFLKQQNNSKKLAIFFFVFSAMCFRLVGLSIFAASFGNWFFLIIGLCFVLLWVLAVRSDSGKRVFIGFLIAFMALFVPLFFEKKMQNQCLIPYGMVIICSILSLTIHSEQAYAIAKAVFLAVTCLWHGLMFLLLKHAKLYIG